MPARVPTFYRILMRLEAWNGAWVPHPVLWEGFGKGTGSWVGRSLHQAMTSGLIERASDVLSGTQHSGWLYELREKLAFDTGLAQSQVWDWIYSYRLTAKGKQQLDFARDQNPHWYDPIAQLEEHGPSKFAVAGSTPAGIANAYANPTLQPKAREE